MSAPCYYNWNDQAGLRYDKSAKTEYERQSRGSGGYQLGNPAIRKCVSQGTYQKLMCEPMHQQRQFRSGGCFVDQETKLRNAKLTDQRYIDQLYTRPYLGGFMGAGRPTNNKDAESRLIHGETTRSATRRACDVLSGVTIDRFEYLPSYGNPQRVQHVVEPWVRGGEGTRDHVRRSQYEKQCPKKK